MMMPIVETFFDPDTANATHLVRDPESPACAVIDTVLDFDARSGRTATRAADRLIERVTQEGLRVEWVLESHIHADHMTAAPYLKDRLGGRIGIGAGVVEVQRYFATVFNADASFVCDGSQFDHLFADGETFRIGGLEGRVLHSPGHTPACAVYVIGDAAFTGDTLFMPDSGTARCDFPAGDARTLYRSIRRILDLAPETRLFVNHDYGADGTRDPAWQTSVAEQRAANIHVRDGISEEEFVALRETRDATLEVPRLILPAIQVNMRAGRLPEPEDNGVRYLKLPLDSF
jgi:glyoxylase-like metal-dependent hydrolase (beta-lactamase superfamily II)